MAQITLRLDDRKADELRGLAARESRSVNALLLSLVDVILDPAAAASGNASLYERLLRAGVVEPVDTDATTPARSSPKAFARARKALADGPSAAGIISEDRG